MKFTIVILIYNQHFYLFQDFKSYSAVVIFQWGDVIVPQGELSACINLKQEKFPLVSAVY